jgi:hypothetical protein
LGNATHPFFANSLGALAIFVRAVQVPVRNTLAIFTETDSGANQPIVTRKAGVYVGEDAFVGLFVAGRRDALIAVV